MAQTFFESFENVTIPANEHIQLFARVRNVKVGDKPIIVALHGYPQSSWEYATPSPHHHLPAVLSSLKLSSRFRYAPSNLPADLPLFIPDLPGYGESTKSTPTTTLEAYTKNAIGADILDGLAQYLGLTSSSPKQKIILLGHDRGARISYRIALHPSQYPRFEILGACLADIVPITVQFGSMANPVNAASVFHWAFLAGPHGVPERIIEQSGGPEWVQLCLSAWARTNSESEERFASGANVYRDHFLKKSVIYASCADYRAAAFIDAKQEAEEQEKGNRLKIPILVPYSKQYLGSRYDVPKVWRGFTEDEKLLTLHGFEEAGHYCFEEAPEESYGAFKEWLAKLG